MQWFAVVWIELRSLRRSYEYFIFGIPEVQYV